MLFDKVAAVERRYDELNQLLSDPNVASDLGRMATLARAHSEIEEIVRVYQAYRAAQSELADATRMVDEESDPEMVELARGEVERLRAEQEQREAQLQRCLLYTSDAADDLLCVDLGGRRI